MSADDHRTPALPLAGGLLAAAVGIHLLPGLAGAWPAIRAPLGVEDSIAGRRGFALTFDDGPHARGTPAVLELLARERVAATFFLVGEQVRRNRALAAELVSAGHQVAIHCDRHRNLLRLTPRQTRTDILRARATIEDACSVSPRLYRPPYGVLNASALALARSVGWRTVLWSAWGRDWEARATPASIAELVTRDAREGSVLLLHDADDYSAPGSWERTVAALPAVLEELRRLGLHAAMP